MWITQEKYLETANTNFKEWFEEENYDIIFMPLVARDYLTAYLMKFQRIGLVAPDIDWVLEKLKNYDKKCVELFKPFDIKFKEGVKSRDFYLNLLYQLKEYVEATL